MLVTLDEIKLYLRLDETDTTEDQLLTSLITSAEEYVKEATGFKFETDVPERVKVIIKLLVAHWYENRELVSTKGISKIDFTIDALLNQIKYTHEEDTV